MLVWCSPSLSRGDTFISYSESLLHEYYLYVYVRGPKYLFQIHADLNAFGSLKMS
jgi:hypothetical protein